MKTSVGSITGTLKKYIKNSCCIRWDGIEINIIGFGSPFLPFEVRNATNKGQMIKFVNIYVIVLNKSWK